MKTLTTEGIREKISGKTYLCISFCEDCPFINSGKFCGGKTFDFDFASMKNGTETELKDLLKYKRPGNNYEYPNLK